MTSNAPFQPKAFYDSIYTKIGNAIEILFCFTKCIHCILFTSHFINRVDANLGMYHPRLSL